MRRDSERGERDLCQRERERERERINWLYELLLHNWPLTGFLSRLGAGFIPRKRSVQILLMLAT